MDESTKTHALTERFGEQPPDIMAELQSMLRLYNLDAEELFFKWDSYCFKMGPTDMKLTLNTVRALKKDVQEQLEKEMKSRVRMQQNATTQKTPRALGKGTDIYGVLDGLVPSTPASGVKRKNERPPTDTPLVNKSTRLADASSPAPASSPLPIRTPIKPSNGSHELQATPFALRNNAGDTTEVLNSHIPKPSAPLPASAAPSIWEERVRLVANSDLKKFSYRPMHQKLTEASEVQDDRIEEFCALIQDHYKLTDDQLGDPATKSPSEIVAVGRIVSDSQQGKLNVASILFESSRAMGSGSRVPLKLDNIRSYAFFPGQVVALKGVNASGEYFVVNEVLEIPRLPVTTSSASELAAITERLSGGELNILLTSGPYTTDDNLEYEALEEICNIAAEKCPDVIIMTGPFIDSEHPLVQAGDFDLETVNMLEGGTFEDLFKERISRKIKKLRNSMVIMVPSLRDVVSKHVAFPQEGLKRKALDLPLNVKCLPNPSIFSLNELVFAVTSTDILFHLAREEIVRAPTEPNPPARLTKHVLSQRSFYPLFPPPPKESLQRGMLGPNIDVPYSRLLDFLDLTPDVLVLPTALTSFAKVVDGTVTVNPGGLSKKLGPGTYAEMTIVPPEVGEQMADGEGGEALVPHKAYERARVDIARI